MKDKFNQYYSKSLDQCIFTPQKKEKIAKKYIYFGLQVYFNMEIMLKD
jgi:hypothetical protein